MGLIPRRFFFMLCSMCSLCAPHTTQGNRRWRSGGTRAGVASYQHCHTTCDPLLWGIFVEGVFICSCLPHDATHVSVSTVASHTAWCGRPGPCGCSRSPVSRPGRWPRLRRFASIIRILIRRPARGWLPRHISGVTQHPSLLPRDLRILKISHLTASFPKNSIPKFALFHPDSCVFVLKSCIPLWIAPAPLRIFLSYLPVTHEDSWVGVHSV